MAKTRIYSAWRNKGDKLISHIVGNIESRHDGQVIVIMVYDEVIKPIEVLNLGEDIKVCDAD